MASSVTQNRVRIAGAGFTLLMFAGQPVAFCDQVRHDSPRPVAQPSFIQPMDEPYPVEILIPPAASAGTLTLNLIELFGSSGNASKVWDRLGANVGNGSTQPFGQLGTNSSLLGQYATNLSPGLGPLAGAVDIVDIIIRQAQINPSQMQITKIIRPLGILGSNVGPYTEDYIGCMITDVQDGETVAVGTKEIIKQITVSYRYLLRDGVASQAFAIRDGAAANITPAAV